SGVVVSGVPHGAVLSAGTDNGDGSWSLSAAQLTGLKITPPANSSDDFVLTVAVTTAETTGQTATATMAVPVTVTGVAATASLTVTAASGAEDRPLPLDVRAALTDTDGSETLKVTIAGVPTGAQLSAGVNNGSGTWTLTPAQLTGLSITPAANYSGSFNLT